MQFVLWFFRTIRWLIFAVAHGFREMRDALKELGFRVFLLETARDSWGLSN
jgi:hypothetical protein